MVANPNPAAGGAHVPLARSFVLSSKKGREAITVPAVENGGWRFAVRAGGIGPDELAQAKGGTRASRGADLTCLLTVVPIPAAHIKAEGMAGRMGPRSMAAVAEGRHGRAYLEPTAEMEEIARQAEPAWRPDGKRPDKALGFRIQLYGRQDFTDLFMPRQLVALTTFSELVREARCPGGGMGARCLAVPGGAGGG